VTADDLERAPLLERIGRALVAIGRYEESERALHDAVDAYRKAEDRKGAARATATLAQTMLQAVHTDAAVPTIAAAIQEFEDLGLDPGLVALRAQYARAHYLIGQNREAIALSDPVLDAAEALDLPDIISDALVTRGSALGNVGRMNEAVALLRAGADLAETNGLWETNLRGRNNLTASVSARDPRAAMEIGRGALADARRLGLRTWVVALLGNLIEVAMYTGDWDWALSEIDQLRAAELEHEDRLWVLQVSIQVNAARGADVAADLAEHDRLAGFAGSFYLEHFTRVASAAAALAAGDLENARSLSMQVAEGDALNAPYGLFQAARIALWQGDRAGAQEAADAFGALGQHGPALALRSRGVEAGILALDGRTGEALRGFRDVVTGLRDMGLPWDEALTAIDMATLLDPNDPEVAALVAAGRDILVRLEAAPYLERLDAAIRRGGGTRTGSRAAPATTEQAPART
jgi:tetratricopeptide (TPR) repeat protein